MTSPGSGGLPQASARDQVLARRRYSLLGLGGGAAVTLLVAIVSGSLPILLLSLVLDVALAGYVAILLSIKQEKQPPPGGTGPA